MNSEEYNELGKFVAKLNNAEDYGPEGKLVLIYEAALKIEDLRDRLSICEDNQRVAFEVNESLRDRIRQLEADFNH